MGQPPSLLLAKWIGRMYINKLQLNYGCKENEDRNFRYNVRAMDVNIQRAVFILAVVREFQV